MSEKKDLDKLLNFDGLYEAEKISGESYKTSKGTSFLGLGLMHRNNAIKNKLLDELGDSKLNNVLTDYLAIVESLGFETVLKEPFLNDDGITEQFYIMFHNKYSVLLSFSSFTWGDDGSWAKANKEVPPPSLSGGNMYYNWKPNKDIDRWELTSSGSMIGDENDDNVWIGHHDCREAIKHNFNGLVESGTFLDKWIERPFLWLLTHYDSKEEYDYEAINEGRIGKLPKHVRDAITPNKIK